MTDRQRGGLRAQPAHMSPRHEARQRLAVSTRKPSGDKAGRFRTERFLPTRSNDAYQLRVDIVSCTRGDDLIVRDRRNDGKARVRDEARGGGGSLLACLMLLRYDSLLTMFRFRLTD